MRAIEGVEQRSLRKPAVNEHVRVGNTAAEALDAGPTSKPKYPIRKRNKTRTLKIKITSLVTSQIEVSSFVHPLYFLCEPSEQKSVATNVLFSLLV